METRGGHLGTKTQPMSCDQALDEIPFLITFATKMTPNLSKMFLPAPISTSFPQPQFPKNAVPSMLPTRASQLGHVLCGLFLCYSLVLRAQPQNPQDPIDAFSVMIDTTTWTWEDNQLSVGGKDVLAFQYEVSQPEAALWLQVQEAAQVDQAQLLPSPDYELLDSTRRIQDGGFRSRIRFRPLSKRSLPLLTYRLISQSADTSYLEITLLPTVSSVVTLPPEERIWYLGQTQLIPLESNLPHNIRPSKARIRDKNVSYRITEKDDAPYLEVIPTIAGRHQLNLHYKTYRPGLDSLGKLQYDWPLEAFSVMVKRGRTRFIELDRDVVELPHDARMKEVMVSFPTEVTLNVKQTYRLEDQEQRGSPAIGELFIEEVGLDNRMKARLRVYDYHRQQDGMLFLADDDEVLFTLNLDILPSPRLTDVELRRAGGDWQRNLQVFPGETVELRLSGESLTRTEFRWTDIADWATEAARDSQIYQDDRIQGTISIPLNTGKLRFPLRMDDEQTPYVLTLQEYQRPRALDFVRITYERKTYILPNVTRQLIAHAPLNHVQIRFVRDTIDQPERLHGPQHLVIGVEVWSADDRLLERKREKRYVICPSSSSPRSASYAEESCFSGVIDLNDLLKTPTHELPGWARIRITVAHAEDVYVQKGQQHSIELVLRKDLALGLEVALPMPIILARFNGSRADNLSSVGFAAFAQLRFYRKRRINQLVPIQAALGIMATDVFSFASEARRDWALSGMACFYPLKKQSNWSVPLYLGGGYLLNEQTGFFFMGPGLSVQF